MDTCEANLALGRGKDERDCTAGAQMLGGIGAGRVRLLNNNPDKAVQLTALGVDVTEQVPTGVHLSPTNLRYLAARRDHTAHTLALPPAAGADQDLRGTGFPAGMAAALNTAIGAAPPAASPTHEEMPARVDALIPRLRGRAEETERIRRVPDSMMENLEQAAIFGLLSPKAVGGPGMGLETYVQVVRRPAREMLLHGMDRGAPH